MLWDVVVAGMAVVGSAWAAARGIRLLLRGVRSREDPSAPLWVIRGLRGLIVAVCAMAIAAGIVLEQRWLLVFGCLWLAEEIYETGVLALILRAGQRSDDSPAAAPATTRVTATNGIATTSAGQRS